MDQLKLYTKAEVAERLAVSEKTVDRMIAAGQLPVYRINKCCTRISEPDLQEYLDSRRRKVAALRQTRPVGPKELRTRRYVEALPCPYKPGDKVV